MKTITWNEHMELVGLMVLADSYNTKLNDIVACAKAIVGEVENENTLGSLTADFVYSSDIADPLQRAQTLLSRLEIMIEPREDYIRRCAFVTQMRGSYERAKSTIEQESPDASS